MQPKNQAKHYAFYQQNNPIKKVFNGLLKTKTLHLKVYSDFPVTVSILVGVVKEFQMKSKCSREDKIISYNHEIFRLQCFCL